VSTVETSAGLSALEDALHVSASPGNKYSDCSNLKRQRRLAALATFRSLLSEYRMLTGLLQVLMRKDTFLNQLKSSQRSLANCQKSREIERKRRLFTAGQVRRRGPPPPEPYNVFDYFATLIQTHVRGLLARRYSARLKQSLLWAVVTIQARSRQASDFHISFTLTNNAAEGSLLGIVGGY
jgi:hypothetical protein